MTAATATATPAEAQFHPRGLSSGFEPYPLTPRQMMWEAIRTPPPGASAAEVMLHALRAELQPETTVVVEATLADGYSRWTLLYTHTGLLIAHRQEY